MRKASVLFLVLVVGMIVFYGISYAAVVGFINAAIPDATGTAAREVVEETVRGAAQQNPTTTTPDDGTLSSNTTVTAKSLASGETLTLDGVADTDLIQLAATTISAMTSQQVQGLYSYSLTLTENQAVVIVGNTDEEANAAKAKFAEMTLKVENAPRLFFGVVDNNPAFVNNLGALFTQFNGDYTRCTVDAYKQTFGGTGRAV